MTVTSLNLGRTITRRRGRRGLEIYVPLALRRSSAHVSIRREMSSITAPDPCPRTDLYHGLFRWHAGPDGQPRVATARAAPPRFRARPRGACCAWRRIEAAAGDLSLVRSHGQGGFVSFVGDLRMAYACPQCCQLVWLAGA